MTAGDIWSDALTRVQTKVNRHTFLTWFYPTSLLTDAGVQLTVLVPNALFTQYLTRQFSNVIAEALREVGRPGSKVQFVADEGGDVHVPEASLPEWTESGEAEPAAAGTPDTGADAYTQSVHPGLNPRYTFDSFVVGPSNQFSHAACQAVAEAPSRSYNPLYIYGGVGLGKTHLMHAVGHYVLAHNPGARLTYVSTERFMNEMIHGMRYGAMLDFRERYRTVDLLLVDDIQYLAGREGTQNEFFHTFNALHDAQKQIVLSSDCPPQEIPSIEDRLRSRFTWGLIADIQPPDLETKVAILKKKAEAESVPLPDGVAIYIAEKIKSNIRELEGSLIRLIAFASLTGREITVSLAQEVLRGIFGREDKAVTIEIVQKFVADRYKLKAIELKSRNNSKSVAMPRQIAMYLCKRLTSASLPEIGRSFGGKHHSTVIHSIKKVESLRAHDRDFNNLINTFMESFH